MPEPIRVLHLIKGLGRGGAETLLLAGLRQADRERFELSFGYFLPYKDALEESLRSEGGEVTCFEASTEAGILLSVPRLVRHLKSRRIDLVHAHLPVAAVAARLATRLAGVPLVTTEHGPLERLHPVTRRLDLATWRLQEAVVAVSPQVAESIRTHAGLRVPVELVINGVDTGHFDPARFDGGRERARIGLPPGAPVVGTVAVFRAQKRLDDWLQVAATLHRQDPRTRFLVVGDGPQRGEIEALAADLGLAEAVVFPGLQEDVRPYLAAMDVFLMTSGYEGLPVALLEAMAMGRPAVSTTVGGIPEVLEGSAAGRLRPVADVEGLAAAVGGLLADPELRREASAAARQLVVRRFGMERMTRQLEELYTRVLEERRGR